MEQEEIKGYWESFLGSLDALSAHDASLVSLRCALRLVPLWLGSYLGGSFEGTPEAAFQTMRSLFCHQVLLARSNSAAVDSARIADEIARRNTFMIHEVTDHGERHAHLAATSVADGYYFPGRIVDFWRQVDMTANYSSGGYTDNLPRIASQCIGDIRLIEQGTDILATALNRTPEDQEWLRQMRDVLHAILSANPDRWSFWLRWWDGVLSGRQIDWELQEQVALIPNGVWGAGPDAVAREIALIEERRRLLDLVEELRRSLGQVSAVARGVASPEHRAHNQPPELLDAPVQVREAVTVIALALDEAEAELKKADPSPSTLSRIATTLSDAVLAALKYCGAKADVFITKAVEEGGSAFGKWGFAVVIASWATPTGSMQSLINGLLDLASKLSH